jgi:hypothetical protein
MNTIASMLCTVLRRNRLAKISKAYSTTIVTYDHRTLRTELPVRSAVLKQCTGGLVVRWVTTSESPLLYVFAFLFLVRSVWFYGDLPTKST